MVLNLLFLIPLFIIGIICSYTDIKYGRIKNKWIALGFCWVIILYFSLGLYNYFFLHQTENINYLIKMAVNGFVALVIGYLLWNFKLLAAGDAKLFTLYAFLIPPEFYSKAYFSIFPSFVLLINIFIPLILFLLIKALVFIFKKGLGKIKEFKIENLPRQIINFLRMYLIFVLLMVVVQLARNKATESFGDFTQNLSPVFLFLFLFFIYRFLFKFISKNKLIILFVVILGGGCIFYLLSTGQTDFFLNILKLALIFMILVGLSYRLLSFYIEQREIRKVKIKNLQEDMFPSLQETNNELQKKIGSVGRTGLTEEQVKIIQNFFSKEPEKEMKIYKTFALSPFILLAAIISILTKDSFVGIVLKAFSAIF